MSRLGQLLRVHYQAGTALESPAVAEYWPSYKLSVKEQDGVGLLEADPALAIDGLATYPAGGRWPPAG